MTVNHELLSCSLPYVKMVSSPDVIENTDEEVQKGSNDQTTSVRETFVPSTVLCQILVTNSILVDD